MALFDEQENIYRVSRAIIYNDAGQVLLGRRARKDEVGKWALIGGGPEPGETAQEAIIREVKEEVGLDFSPVFYREMMDRLPNQPKAWLVTFFTGPAVGSVHYDTSEVSEVIWANLADLDQLDITFNHRDILKEFLAQANN